jgi:uncharacterized protein YndB with AHSA1/START domain
MENNSMESRAVVNVRIFDTTCEKLFNAWAEPELLSQWWGPKGFTNTFHEFDFRPGGIWKLTMHASNGADYHNTSVFEEIVRPHRIVLQHLLPVHKFQLTATFEALDDKVKLTFYQLFETVEECERIKKFVTEANEQNLDRLEAVIYKTGILK